MQKSKTWLYHCRGCGFLSSTLEAGGGTGIEGLEDLRRSNNEVLLDRLERNGALNGKRILEVGSAWGWFLEAAVQRGASVHGIEPETENVITSKRRLGLEIEQGYFPRDLVDRGPFDVIVFNDVFEHIPEPATVIKSVAGMLSTSGIAVINLPSSSGTLYRIASSMDAAGISGPFDRLWQKGFPSPHISYFNRHNLKTLVERNTNLRLIDWFALHSVTRSGLYARVRSSQGGAAGAAMFAGIWLLSHVLPWLPADIQVAFFRASD